MSSATGTPFILVDQDIRTMSGIQSAHYLEIACFTLLVYDLLTTFGEEVEYFWSGPWSISRVLFFLNRYLPFIAMIGLIQIILDWLKITITGILLLRVWYMYSHSAILRAVACFSYAACALSSLILMGWSLQFLESSAESLELQRKISSIPGCSAPSPSMIWTVFVPSAIIHTILFGFTIAQIVKVSRDSRKDQLMLRLVRDGGLVFFVSLASAIYSTVGARLTTDPAASYSYFTSSQLAISAVAVSRLMLSIRSLAAKLKTSPNWLFNPSELSRVRWRAVSGDYGRSIVVEMDTYEPEAQKL
ncbi:hypothetical protein DEU56DRAFT_732713 [Suillus clintonianus]|uniref:uncharacterized protein n=1 Tax=Suillus clintonianus TaxID=1904413 RepID=UPI001B87A923|nr:uncharacterized protein DEU56DRAFT_732713 [Suillus clintonianus]KAG2144505.1 hypothetical protein DEU56DRAFT_732713 [Suillus clintonianus]